MRLRDRGLGLILAQGCCGLEEQLQKVVCVLRLESSDHLPGPGLSRGPGLSSGVAVVAGRARC